MVPAVQASTRPLGGQTQNGTWGQHKDCFMQRNHAHKNLSQQGSLIQITIERLYLKMYNLENTGKMTLQRVQMWKLCP